MAEFGDVIRLNMQVWQTSEEHEVMDSKERRKEGRNEGKKDGRKERRNGEKVVRCSFF